MKYLLCICLCIFLATTAKAQALTDVANGTFTIDSMYILTVGSGTNFVFGGVNDYANGVEKLNYSAITIKCNYNWFMNVRATTALFSGGGGNMPCGVLSIRKSGGSYATVTNTAALLASGNRGSTNVNGNSFNVDLRATPGYLYNGGNYSIILQYTVTRQ